MSVSGSIYTMSYVHMSKDLELSFFFMISHPYGLQDPQVQNGALELPSITVTELLCHGSVK